jgi:hypothetical protein
MNDQAIVPAPGRGVVAVPSFSTAADMYQHLSQHSANGSLCMLDMKFTPDGKVTGLSAKSGKAEELLRMQTLVNEREKMQIEHAQNEQGSFQRQAEMLNTELGATYTRLAECNAKLAECEAERQRLSTIAVQQSAQITRCAEENQEVTRLNHILGAYLTSIGIDVADVLRGNGPAVVPRPPAAMGAAMGAAAAAGAAMGAPDQRAYVNLDDDDDDHRGRSGSYSHALGVRVSHAFKAGDRRAARSPAVKVKSEYYNP